MSTPVSFDWTDPLNAKSLFTEEELAISETAEAYCQERMLPRVLGMYMTAQDNMTLLT
jgi:glutaryl-CoA dehydrogenase